MNIHEFQVKQLFTRYGLPVPNGRVCRKECEIKKIITEIGPGPWVAKCQIYAGGRGRSGGIKILKTEAEVFSFVKYWIGKKLITCQTSIIGQSVNEILIEEMYEVTQELYFGIIIDAAKKRIAILTSKIGGINIEEIAKKSPESIHKIMIDPLIGLQPYHCRLLAFRLGLIDKQISQFKKIFMNLIKIFLKYDLTFLEVNPLIISNTGDLICLDGKLNIDNNALFRQEELFNIMNSNQEDDKELYAANLQLNYVKMEGTIGCMVNGAGLAMGTMDIIRSFGGKPANFLDIGGSATKARVMESFKIILSDKKVKAILINIFGGIVRCDLIADGIIDAVSEIDVSIPIVTRLEGNSSDLGIKKLLDSKLNIFSVKDIITAVHLVISMVE